VQVLGMESDKAGFSFVVLSRDAAESSLVSEGHRSAPANTSRSLSLAWVYSEIADLISEFAPAVVGLKRSDIGLSLSNAVLEHAEVDGVIQAAIGAAGLLSESFQWKSLSSRLGFAKKAEAIEHLKLRPEFSSVARSRMTALGTALVVRAS
jgi:hypothetical protein